MKILQSTPVNSHDTILCSLKNKNNVFKDSHVGNGSRRTLTEKKKKHKATVICIYYLYLVKIISSIFKAF